MVANYAEEYKALAQQFDEQWRTVPLGATYLTLISWENIAFTPPNPPASWVEYRVLNGESVQATFGAPGSNTFRHNGVVSINIYVPSGQGKPAALALADRATAIYRVQRTDGILFRAPSVNILGDDGGYFRVNVSVSFFRDTPL